VVRRRPPQLATAAGPTWEEAMSEQEPLRVLFCMGVSQTFFDEEAEHVPGIAAAITEAFGDLRGRFGIEVLGTFDDDRVMVGPSPAWPWTCYILADAPSLDAVVQVCNILREGPVGSHRLWRYLRIEARVGRKLFFGNS
jgi:hypothetical protein